MTRIPVLLSSGCWNFSEQATMVHPKSGHVYNLILKNTLLFLLPSQTALPSRVRWCLPRWRPAWPSRLQLGQA